MTELASGTAGELNVAVNPFEDVPFQPEPTRPHDVPGEDIFGFVVLVRTVNAPPSPTSVPFGDAPNENVVSDGDVIEKISPAEDAVLDN